MGIFSRKGVGQEANQPRHSIAWQLINDGRALELSNVHVSVLDTILTASGTPNRNAVVHVALTYTAVGQLEAYWQGERVGEASGHEVAAFREGFEFLSSTDRYAIVPMTTSSRKSKGYGSALLLMPYSGMVVVPFNQPPSDFRFAPMSRTPELKNEHLHAGDLRQIAPANGTPGWFVLVPTSGGGVDAYAPEFGRTGPGIRVGAVYKEDVPQTLEQLAGESRAVTGRVLWYDRGPQIRLN